MYLLCICAWLSLLLQQITAAYLRPFDVGTLSSCVVLNSGQLYCYGTNQWKILTVPSGTNFVQVVGRGPEACSLTSTNQVICWGRNDWSQSTPPPAILFTQLAAGHDAHMCGITIAGNVMCWGFFGFGQLNAPAESYSYIALSHYVGCGIIKSTRFVVCWGDKLKTIKIPRQQFIDVAVGPEYACGLGVAEGIICWGKSTIRPLLDFFQIQTITSFYKTSCAVFMNGTLLCWSQFEQPVLNGTSVMLAVIGQNNVCTLSTTYNFSCVNKLLLLPSVLQCLPGTFSLPGFTECELCPNNTISQASSPCIPCNDGLMSFNNSCISCPTHSAGAGYGKGCVYCPHDTFVNAENKTRCILAQPIPVTAVAMPRLNSPGLGNGSTVKVIFDSDVKNGTATIGFTPILLFSSVFKDNRTLVVTIQEQSFPDVLLTGLNNIRLLVYGQQRLDSVKCQLLNYTLRVVGSWGDFQRPNFTAAATHNSTIQIVFDSDTNQPALFQINNVMLVSSWTSLRTCILFSSQIFRVGKTTINVNVSARDGSSFGKSSATLYGDWGNNIVDISYPQLTTAGGQIVIFKLEKSLGYSQIITSATARYGEKYMANCTVSLDGILILCTTSKGVGTQHSWQLTGVGININSNNLTTGYAPPVIYAVHVKEELVDADGGQLVFITGSNFGDDNTVITNVSCYPRAFPNIRFTPTNCSILNPSVQLSCLLPPVSGQDLIFELFVAGQKTSNVALVIMDPIIQNVVFDTDRVLLSGNHFGENINIENSILLSFGQDTADLVFNIGCFFKDFDILCQTSSIVGYGQNLSFKLTILGRVSNIYETNFSYPQPLLLTPHIVFPVSGGILELYGMWLGTLDVVYVVVDGIKTKLISWQLPIKKGFGARHVVSLLVYGRQTNNITFGFEPPTLTTFIVESYTDNWIIRLRGSGFNQETHCYSNCEVIDVFNDEIRVSVKNNNNSLIYLYVSVADQLSNMISFDPEILYPKPIVQRVENSNMKLRGSGFFVLYGANLAPAHPATILIVQYDKKLNCTASYSKIQCGAIQSTRFVNDIVLVFTVGQDTTTYPLQILYDSPVAVFESTVLFDPRGGDLLLLHNNSTNIVEANNLKIFIGMAECVRINTTACVVPPGHGTNVYITTTQSGYPVLNHGSVSYKGPLIYTVTPKHSKGVGGQVSIYGDYFGMNSVLYMNNVSLQILELNFTSILFVAPPGYGTQTITLFSGNQFTAVTLLYDAPIIFNVGLIDALTGSLVHIGGMNFFGGKYGLKIKIGAVDCINSTYVDDSTIYCVASGGNVGDVLVTVLIDSAVGYGHTTFVCPDTHYTVFQKCMACPSGAVCDGSNAISLVGYTRVLSKSDEISFIQCIPPHACVSKESPNCAVGYTGVYCSACETTFYRNGVDCIQCSDSSTVILILFFLGLIGIGLFLGFLHHKQVNLKGATVLIDLFQMLTIFGSFDFNWPPILQRIFTVASVSSFSPNIVSPECSIEITFAQLWYIIQLFPPIVFCFLSFGIFMSVAATMRTLDIGFVVEMSLNPIIGTFYSLMYYMYFILVKQALLIFVCVEYGNRTILRADPAIECWSGEQHIHIVPYAIISLVVYGCGVPFLFYMALYKHRITICADQKNWLCGLTEIDNVRRRYSKLYQDYRPGYGYWKLLLIIRKLILTLISILAFNNSMFQASLCIATLLVSYVMHEKHNPFISSLIQQELLKDIEDPRLLTSDCKIPSLINYNMMESILILSSCFIVLGGMIFESTQFTTNSFAYICITTLVCAVIFGSIFVFLIMLLREIMKIEGNNVTDDAINDVANNNSEEEKWQKNPLSKSRKTRVEKCRRDSQ